MGKPHLLRWKANLYTIATVYSKCVVCVNGCNLPIWPYCRVQFSKAADAVSLKSAGFFSYLIAMRAAI